MSEFSIDPFAIDEVLDEIDPQVQQALDEAALLSEEPLPPLRDEPLKVVVEAYASRRVGRTPEPNPVTVTADPTASLLLEAWGEQAFYSSTYWILWVSEWRHQCALLEHLKAPKPSAKR